MKKATFYTGLFILVLFIGIVLGIVLADDPPPKADGTKSR